jgi:chemotaxis protein MotB
MARRRHHEEHANHEAWAIPYGDLVTLLLAFFVVMYAMSSVNEGKYRVLSDSLNSAFRGTPMRLEPVQVGQKQQGAGDNLATTVIPNQEPREKPRALITPVSVDTGDRRFAYAGAGGEAATQAEAEARARQAKQLGAVAASMTDTMSELIDRGMVVVRRKADSVEVEIRTDILFPSGQSTLTPGAVGVLERVGDALEQFPNPLLVEGHTDNRPINTLQFPSNWELSAARAASVVHLFTQRGLDPSRLTVIGYGEHRPVGDNATREGRNANRRVLLVIRGALPETLPDAIQVVADVR